MAIIGTGVDIVDLARFERILDRTPALRDRLFADAEQNPGGRTLSLRSLAARFAAKEAFMKALGESTGIRWHDMQVVADDHGNPSLEVGGAAAALARERGASNIHLSMSHDAGVAIAQVILEGAAPRPTPAAPADRGHFGQMSAPVRADVSEMTT